MHKPLTYLKRHLVQQGCTIIGTGSLSIIVESDDPNYVIKHTNCSATVMYLNGQYPKTKGIRLMQGEFLECYGIHGVGEHIYAFKIPRLYSFKVSELNREQLIAYRSWSRYLKAVRNSINYLSSKMTVKEQIVNNAISLLPQSSLPKLIKQDLYLMLLDFNSEDGELLDTKVRGNILLDRDGNLVISDPVFNRTTWETNTFY